MVCLILEYSNALGKIEIDKDVIATIAGISAMDCYGLIGMVSRRQIKDGIIEILGKDNLSKGIEVRNENGIIIDMYIIVSYGTKISEVAHNIQTKVKYVFEDVVGIEIKQINVFVQDVRLNDAM